MGRHGPPPTPTALKILRGNPGKRSLNKNEPMPEMGLPEMPDKVKNTPRAAQEWDRIGPILVRMKVLTEADYLALAGLCMAVAMEDDAQNKIDATGLLIETKRTGVIHLNPLLKARDAASDRVYRYLREFGMTPASRSGVSAASGAIANDDPWSQFG